MSGPLLPFPIEQLSCSTLRRKSHVTIHISTVVERSTWQWFSSRNG